MINEKDLSDIVLIICEKYPEIEFDTVMKFVDEILIYMIIKEG